jgi:hypothetical protein
VDGRRNRRIGSPFQFAGPTLLSWFYSARSPSSHGVVYAQIDGLVYDWTGRVVAVLCCHSSPDYCQPATDSDIPGPMWGGGGAIRFFRAPTQQRQTQQHYETVSTSTRRGTGTTFPRATSQSSHFHRAGKPDRQCRWCWVLLRCTGHT